MPYLGILANACPIVLENATEKSQNVLENATEKAQIGMERRTQSLCDASQPSKVE